MSALKIEDFANLDMWR